MYSIFFFAHQFQYFEIVVDGFMVAVSAVNNGSSQMNGQCFGTCIHVFMLVHLRSARADFSGDVSSYSFMFSIGWLVRVEV